MATDKENKSIDIDYKVEFEKLKEKYEQLEQQNQQISGELDIYRIALLKVSLNLSA